MYCFVKNCIKTADLQTAFTLQIPTYLFEVVWKGYSVSDIATE